MAGCHGCPQHHHTPLTFWLTIGTEHASSSVVYPRSCPVGNCGSVAATSSKAKSLLQIILTLLSRSETLLSRIFGICHKTPVTCAIVITCLAVIPVYCTCTDSNLLLIKQMKNIKQKTAVLMCSGLWVTLRIPSPCPLRKVSRRCPGLSLSETRPYSPLKVPCRDDTTPDIAHTPARSPDR